MKKLIALSLCLCFLLSGCPALPDTLDEASFSRFAAAEAAYPEIPKQPDANAVYEKLSELNYNDKDYDQKQQELWDEYNAQEDAYRTAMQELRGDGIPADSAGTFLGFTQPTVNALFEKTEGTNCICSPANLYMALCMLCETTDGNSRAQLLELLGLSSAEEARAAANALWRSLYRDDNSGKTLLANSIWLNKDVPCDPETVKTLAEQYYASSFSVPMGTKETDKAIADWINENTNDLLAEQANALKTDPLTVMALLSTIYFKGSWSDPFSGAATSPDEFTNADGSKSEVDFMHRTQDRAAFLRAEDEGYTVAELPFSDGLAMRFLLPDEDVALASLIESGAASGGLLVWDRGVDLPIGKIRWSVPKFDVSSDLDLSETLQELGVTDIFNDNVADFSPLTDTETPIAVTSAEHAARVLVDEDGCEAAAFTAFMVGATAMPPQDLPEVEMDLDRPFTFMITGADGLPLFMGVVNEME